MRELDVPTEDLDPGVRGLVRWLRANGFDTIDSGDGRSKLVDGHPMKEEALPFAHVFISAQPDQLTLEADRLRGLLGEYGVTVEALRPHGRGRPRIEASYCPVDRRGVLALLHVTDLHLVTG